VVLTGFMGTGKSTSGPLAAERLGLPYVDLDRRQERIAGMQIARIFDELGEPAFRDIERQALKEAAALSGTVIACGGGAAPLHPKEYADLAEGSVAVVLMATPEAIEKRVGDASDRPLLTSSPGEQIRALLAERAEAYAAAGEQLDTTDVPSETTAEEIATLYRKRVPTGLTSVEVGGSHGPVIIGDGALAAAGDEIASRLPEARTAAVVRDPNAREAAEAVAASISAAGLDVARLTLPSGEDAKSLFALGDLLAEFRGKHVEPTDVVVSVGGGATMDASGFAAATYARGIALVNVPTTLLGMVDASLGGKVAIDHAGAKNLVGSFHPPALVLIDPSTLGTLPETELRTGFAEIVKAAVLASPLLLDWLQKEDPMSHLEWVIEQAVRIKAAFVAADPRDRGVRRSLNLGHTFAHAIEAASGYDVSHGEAVAMGLVAASRLGSEHGVTDPQQEARVVSILESLELPVTPPAGLDPDALLEAMTVDKKRRSGSAVFVVPAPGGAALLEGIEPKEAISFLLPTEAGKRS
jgi:3-dehydroquinate synthase